MNDLTDEEAGIVRLESLACFLQLQAVLVGRWAQRIDLRTAVTERLAQAAAMRACTHQLRVSAERVELVHAVAGEILAAYPGTILKKAPPHG